MEKNAIKHIEIVFAPIRKAAERQIIDIFRHAKSSSLPNRMGKARRITEMLTHQSFQPATPLTPEAIPLPRLPHYTRTECGHHAGGEFKAWHKALTAKLHSIIPLRGFPTVHIPIFVCRNLANLLDLKDIPKL